MCRFTAYLGAPVIVSDVLYKSKHSLIAQSQHAFKTEYVLNGDGFGLGWYTPEISPEPGLFRSIRPAWNDPNLKYLSCKIRTHAFAAHVRSVTQGEVSLANCHPFHNNKFLFMHNGDVENFSKIKRYFCAKLSDQAYEAVKGQTDSEHLFALWGDKMSHIKEPHSISDYIKAFRQVLETVKELEKTHKVSAKMQVSCVLCDGQRLFALRYSNRTRQGDKGQTLYYALGVNHETQAGYYYMDYEKSEKPKSLLVVSEPLDKEHSHWVPVKANQVLLAELKEGVVVCKVKSFSAFK